MKRIVTLVVLIICLFAAGGAVADAPVFPAQYFGTVQTSDGIAIPAGTVLTATLNAETFSFTITETGKLGNPGTFGEKFLISPTDSAASGKTITFFIGSEAAPETETFTPNAAKELALTFDISVPVTSAESGKKFMDTNPIVIAENTIPAGFSLTVSDVSADELTALQPYPDNTTVLKLIRMQPVNPPEGKYTIVCTYTIPAAELSAANVTGDSVFILHYDTANKVWEKVTMYIKSKNPDNSVTYEVWADNFSVFAVAAASVPVAGTWKEETAYVWNATTKPSVSRTPSPAGTTVSSSPTQPTLAPEGTVPLSTSTSTTASPKPTQTPLCCLPVVAGLGVAILFGMRKQD